jgi:hypothetical protein
VTLSYLAWSYTFTRCIQLVIIRRQVLINVLELIAVILLRFW